MEDILISSETEMRIESGVDIENGSKVDSTLKRNAKFQLVTKHYSGFKNSTADFNIETLNPDNNSRKRPFGFDHHHPGHSGKRVDGSDFVENGLDPELCFGITFRRIGAGLENLGNTCFLNSVVQCLTYTEPLAAYLQSGKHQNSCHVAGFCALCAIQKHVSRALQSSGRSLVPKDLVSNLRCISRNFRNARQEDAHEYMVNLLESMHKCCLPSGVPSESPAAYETSLVHKIFGGSLCSQVECQQCSYCSNKFDPFLDLSLEIAKADTLPALLRNFTAAEMLDGGEKHYQCQRCKQKVRAKKRLTVQKAPHVLTIHLKRFHAHDPGRKVDRKVIFDRSLDMKPFVSGSYEGDLKYSLYGVLVHYGHNTHSGHYVCFVRTSSGIWHLLNDNQVRQVSEKAVLDQKAYMLFYVRDRKTIVSRKPVDVVQKESMKATFGNNFADLVAKQFSKECVGGGLIGNSLEATDSSAVMNKKDASSVVTSSEIHPKDTSFQQSNRQTLLKVDSSLETSSAPLSTDPSKLANSQLRECLPPSTASLNSNNAAPKLENAFIITEAKTSDCKEPSSSSSGPQSSAIDKLVTRETSQKINVDQNVGVSSQAPCEDSCGKTVGEFPRLAPSEGSTDKAFDKSNTVKSPNKPGCESDQVGDIPIESAAWKTPSDKAGEGGQYIVHQLVEGLIPTASVPSVIQNECLQSKAPDCLPKKKLKNKLLKRRMHLGTNLFKVSFGLQKRKKHKESNCHASKSNNLIKENLLELLENDGFSSELGPSTSKISSTVLLVSMNSHSQRKMAKSGSRRGDNLRNCGDTGVVDVESVERISPSSAVLAMDEQRRKISISISEVNQGDPREPDCSENSKRYASQNRMMGVITGGVEETVAPWDGIEMPPQIVESNGVENLSTGYVADEWDEEYDRGKRKKPRQSMHNFDGPNLFQVLATKKTQVKKAKIDRSRSGNQPFRI
ncbi:ubiquitin carboxyl-terminal hydrolase 23 [Populus alba x Populus x berolinensis]|nr:ubiquitin carboxyl-terminal hydrolase 23 [Populus alba x Populus x berolinensis]